MGNIYQSAFYRVLKKARDNPGHNISSLEISEILLEERNRVLVKDQADMLNIDLQTVDIP